MKKKMLFKESPFYHCIRRQKIKICKILKGNEPSVANSLKVRSDDVFLVSYPRSGNTWMRFVLGSLIHNTDVNFDNMEIYFPDIYRNTHVQLESLRGPRYLKSHEPYDKRYPKVIYIFRDPRDIAISYFYWMLKFNKYEGEIDGFLDMFFDPDGISYGRWDDHYESWIDNSDKVNRGVLFLRYEELIDNTIDNIKTILNFININIDNDVIHNVVKRNSFSGMKNKENYASDQNPLFKATNKEIPFVREGTTGQWKSDLSDIHLERFRREFGPTMKQIGYI